MAVARRGGAPSGPKDSLDQELDNTQKTDTPSPGIEAPLASIFELISIGFNP